MSLTTLTVTVYMIVQGLAPSFWGSFSDAIGRRAIFIGTFVVYIIANIALGVSNNYGELMAFRALQAAGSAATISIGNFFPCCLPYILVNHCRCWRDWRHYHIS
jgi:MFS family permease